MNGPLGLEQGFTIAHRVYRGSRPLRLSLAVGTGLHPKLAGNGRALVFRSAQGAVAYGYGGLVASDARGHRLTAWLALRGERVELLVSDRGAHYPLRIDPFIQQGEKLVGTGAVRGANQGWSVSLSADGNTALVGGPCDGHAGRIFCDGTGAAWVFVRSGSAWSQQGPKLVGSGAVGAAQEGWSVALSGDGNTALVGGPGDDGGLGATWVFTRSGTTWTQQGPKLVGTGAVFRDTGAEQGHGVAISADGNTAVVGGPLDNWDNRTGSGGPGAAWVFVRSGSTWTQQGQKLVGTGADIADGFVGEGESVALSGDGNTALIGPYSVGAWVFTKSGATWAQQGPRLQTVPGIDWLSPGVALSGDGNTALIGAPSDCSGGMYGGTWVFTRSASSWSKQASFGDDCSSGSVALSDDGNTAAVGHTNYSDSGQARVYTRSGSSWSQSGPQLVGTGGAGGSSQGMSVALSAHGQTALIGGAYDNQNPSDPNDWTGAAWVFAVVPPSTVDSITPTSGITGSSVTIAGTNLTGAESVKFGGLETPSFTVVSDAEIKATVPDGAVAGKVSVTTPRGTATSAQDFNPTLSITSLRPVGGLPGTVVDIRGIGFTPGATVQFNGAPAASVSYASSGEVEATVPSLASTGPVPDQLHSDLSGRPSSRSDGCG